MRKYLQKAGNGDSRVTYLDQKALVTDVGQWYESKDLVRSNRYVMYFDVTGVAIEQPK